MARTCQYISEGRPCGETANRFLHQDLPGGGHAEILLCYDHDEVVHAPEEIVLEASDMDSEE